MRRLKVVVECKICNKTYKSNVSGVLTNHVLNVHNMTLQDYIVVFEYKNIEPKCECGCGNRPVFRRSKFLKYAEGHKTVNNFKEQYIKSFGEPKCLNCGKLLKFKRKRRKVAKFCSHKCVGAFNKQIIIDKMRPKIIEKWKEKDYRKLKVQQAKEMWKIEGFAENIKNKRKIRFQNTDYKTQYIQKHKDCCTTEVKQKISNTLKVILKNTKYKKFRSDYLKQQWQNKEYVDKLMNSLKLTLKNRLSKLHVKIRTELNLDKYGFQSEQHINRYIVDEINKEKKIIIEINGNYVHANPRLFKENDIIRLPSQQYTAQQKWKKDNEKINNLKQMGFRVLVIWQYDFFNNLQDVKNKLNSLIDDSHL
jgi:very-short-patch-repair endonuclease